MVRNVDKTLQHLDEIIKLMIDEAKLDINQSYEEATKNTSCQTNQEHVTRQPVGDLRELEDKQERTNNVVIYGIPESTSDDITIRNNHDEISCKEMYCRFGYRSRSCPNYQAWSEKRWEAPSTESEVSRRE
jgi:hypothetical protein